MNQNTKSKQIIGRILKYAMIKHVKMIKANKKRGFNSTVRNTSRQFSKMLCNEKKTELSHIFDRCQVTPATLTLAIWCGTPRPERPFNFSRPLIFPAGNGKIKSKKGACVCPVHGARRIFAAISATRSADYWKSANPERTKDEPIRSLLYIFPTPLYQCIYTMYLFSTKRKRGDTTFPPS